MTTTRPPGLDCPPTRWELQFPAKADQLAEVRHRTQEWLTQCPLDEYQAYDVLLAVGEACANAIEHGHRGDGGTVRLAFARDVAALRVTVADHGRWKSPDPGPDQVRGRGMAIIRALIPEVEVRITSRGTTVDMRIPLPR
ncbi:MAG: ATP-binding protein [Nocardia sp.]|nr:ATP-binding protein [Nocardia sp.]